MTAVNWKSYQACTKCIAGLGEPCLALSGVKGGPVEVPADKPHAGRRLRAGYARTGGDNV